MRLLSTKATCNSHGQDSSYFLGWQEYEKNPYDEVHNPKGIIQMGLAENQTTWASFFQEGMVDFMAEIRGNKVTFDPNHMVLTAGATSANETLIFDRDLKWRTGAEIVPIQCTSSNNFQITESALQQAYEEAGKRNLRVKASCDEIYSGTVFSSPGFISIMEILKERNNDLKDSEVWNRVHVVYSLSKDLGLPGFRVGAIYSETDDVVAAATKCQASDWSLHKRNTSSQHCLGTKKFTKNYIAENQKRLKRRQRMLVSGLAKAGIGALRAMQGLYQVGLISHPVPSCHCTEPGWFRVCFANMSEETLNLAMKRLKAFVVEYTAGNGSCTKNRISNGNSKRKSLTKWVFRYPLAIINHREEER
ncbi:Pyridoxal phosphate-dependent transferase, major domain [Sesbania bispinosa]|nr:Pyridoxal phosphate-dependent transferase, major domain [Sesbania bispinosa]